MEICTTCNKTYKNISTLKAHYNSNIHKQKIALAGTTHADIEANTTRPHQQQHISSNTGTNTHQPSNSYTTTSAMEPDNDDEYGYEYGCISCNGVYKTKQELEKHQNECPDFVLAIILSMKTGINLGLCLKTIFNNKLYEAGNDRIAIHIKLMELEKMGRALDINVNQKIGAPRPSTDETKPSNIEPESNAFTKGVEGNWVNFREVRPIYEENMIMFRQPENRDKLLASGRNCFKTLLDIVYSHKENMNWYIVPINKYLATTITFDGNISIVQTNTVLSVLINKYIDFIINMFINSGLNIKQIYDNLGINIITKDNNIIIINNRIEEYDKYMYEMLASIESQAIKNINLFDTVKHKLIESDKNLFKFDKYTLTKCDMIFTYMQQSQSTI
jgi:hypothetical protein